MYVRGSTLPHAQGRGPCYQFLCVEHPKYRVLCTQPRYYPKLPWKKSGNLIPASSRTPSRGSTCDCATKVRFSVARCTVSFPTFLPSARVRRDRAHAIDHPRPRGARITKISLVAVCRLHPGAARHGGRRRRGYARSRRAGRRVARRHWFRPCIAPAMSQTVRCATFPASTISVFPCLPVAWQSLICTHTFQYGAAVEIGGLTISPGDLIHGDCHGVRLIPLAVAHEIRGDCRADLTRGAPNTELCQSPNFSLDRLERKLEKTAGGLGFGRCHWTMGECGVEDNGQSQSLGCFGTCVAEFALDSCNGRRICGNSGFVWRQRRRATEKPHPYPKLAW